MTGKFKKGLISALAGISLIFSAGCISIRPELSMPGTFPCAIEETGPQPTMGAFFYNSGEYRHKQIKDSAGNLKGINIKKYNWTKIPQGQQTLMAPEGTTNVGVRGPYEFISTYYWISFDVEKENFPGLDVKEGRWVDEYIMSGDLFLSRHSKRLYWSPDLFRLIRTKNKDSLEAKFLDYNKKEKPVFVSPVPAGWGWFGNR